MTWPHGDPDSVARSVLSEPLFRHVTATTDLRPGRPVIEIVWDWFFEHVLQPIFAPLARAFHAAHGAVTLAGVLVVILALGVTGFAVVRLALAFARPQSSTGAKSAEPPASDARSANGWRSLAREAAARGDYARAIAALWSAALVLLDDRNLVAFDPARTPGEYRRLVSRTLLRAGAPFEQLGERFVVATYSPVPPGETDFEVAERALAEFEPAL